MVLLSCNKKGSRSQNKIEGYAFGTTFHISYNDSIHRNYTKQIDSLFYLINKSLSTYISTSDISKINRGDTSIIVDDHFKEVYKKSLKIFKETGGLFDPTIGVLVNAWGFGPNKPLKLPDSMKIKELLRLVGFEKIQLVKGKIIKEHDSIFIDFNAIAKGYAVDVVGRFLESQHVMDYLVEIGGEIRSRGQKNNHERWKIGIEHPNFDGTRTIQKTIVLKNKAIATSGSYRKFIIDSISGNKYIHILNAKTGYPTHSELLSVSVIGQVDCADVDAYATAIMAMSFKEALKFLEKHPALEGFLIYSDQKGNLKTYTTSNF
jgi:thiamine biosynthesis lipoprotein